MCVFFQEHSQFTRHQGKKEAISFTRSYHLHPLHRQLVISRVFSAERSLLHVTSGGHEPSTLTSH